MSNCTGRRKALLIGINYFGQRGQLRGCINDVKNMSAVYGTFALVLGLMSWLYLQAELTLYAVEVDVVRVRHQWPRSMVKATPAVDRDQEMVG